MQNKLLVTLFLLAGILHAHAGPLVYEPFDYEPVNDPVGGRLEGKNGGLGFGGPWVNSSGNNLGLAFVYDSRGNPEGLFGGTFGGGQPSWNGTVNNLPTRGGYVGLSDWSNEGSASEDKWNSHRPLALSAGELAGEDGVLWLSVVWRWPGSTFQNRPGIALTDGSHFGAERSTFLTSSGTGIGVGNGNVGSWPSAILNPTVWANGNEVAQSGAGSMTGSGTHVIILKFEFGAIDKVSAWSFTENQTLSEEVFHANAATTSFAIDEFSLNTLAFSAFRKATAVDEFRIGSTFEDVTTEVIEPDERFEVTEITRDPASGDITLTWRSRPGQQFGLQWSLDLETFYPGVSQAIPAHASGALTTFGPFAPPVADAERLFLRVGPPDTTPPFLVGMGGGGDRIVLTYSEPMLPGSATDPANYLLAPSGGGTIGILSAAIGDSPNTVVLTLASIIEVGESYSVTVNNVSDPAGLPIAAGSKFAFTAWDSPLITEFMASSGGNMYGTEVLFDEDGDSPDWIEISNPTADTVNLAGWHITDNAGNLTKWPLPEIVLLPGAHLVVFASNKDRRDPFGELHTNFSLAAEGEYLALVRPAGQGLASEFSPAYPPQIRGISYGLMAGSTEYRYFDEPTPWYPNAANGFLGVVDGIEFSKERGFQEGPLGVELGCPTPEVTIRYTLDASEPSLTNGITYDSGAPIPIAGTTAIRARAFKSGWLPGTLDTRTYIFASDVLTQPTNPSGFPSNWGSQTAMYGVDPAVMARYSTEELEDALKSLPSISIVSETPNLFSSTGIYSNRFEDGENWERPASMEWIDPTGGPEIQVNCGLRLQGNAARIFPKKPFRLLFKGIYGPTSLDFPVLAEFADAATSFDTITLRSNSQDRNWGAIMQITDENGRRTLADMGTPQSRGTFVHLYVNGLYWGLYNPVERPNASFCADYFGGTKDEWDVNNGDKPTNGTREFFEAMLAQIRSGPVTDAAFQKIQGKFPDGSPDPAAPAYIDMPNYIDYMLANFYLGTGDWAGNASQGTRNYYSARHRVPDSPGYHWLIWDAERSLQNSIPTGNIFGPAEPFTWLRNNAEFRLQFADHVQRHLYNGGALTTARRQPAFTALADRIRAAIIFDEARWDQTTVSGFENHIASRTAWFPGRAAAVINHFKNQGLIPQTETPAFSQHGGELSHTNPLTMTTAAGAIYYTLDGTDPRLLGGVLSPSALEATLSGGSPQVSEPLFFTGPVTLMARSFNTGTGEWSALLEAEFTYANPVPERIDLVEGSGAQMIDPVHWFGPPVANPLFLSTSTSHPAVAAAVIDGEGKLLLDGLLRGGSELTVTFDDGQNPPRDVRVPVLVHPSAHPLAGGVYEFGEWSPATPAGTFPPHMIFLQGGENDSSLATALDRAYHIPANDAAASADVDFPYAASSRTRLNGLGQDGIAFINTGRGRDLGGALLALDTSGLDEARLAFTAGTVLPNTRIYAIRLQYRIGHSGEFSDLSDASSNPVEYLRNPTAGHETSFGPLDLPAHLLGRPYVQLLWRYHRIEGTSGPRAQLRLEDIRVAAGPGDTPAELAFDGAPSHAQSGAPLAPLVVRVLDAGGFRLADFDGTVTLSLIGDGTLTGTLSTNAVNGTATFDDLVLTGTGVHQLVATIAGLDPATGPAFRSLALTELLLPRFIQAGQDADLENNARVPFAWHARIDGLDPHATYRYGNRVVLATDAAGNNGAGNMIFITGAAADWIRNTSSPRFRDADLGSRHHTFTAGSDGSFTGWFVTEPSGNPRFTPGNELFMRLLLNDGADGEETAFILTSSGSATALRFGSAPGDGTGIIGETTAAPRTIALLYDAADGDARPLAATPVEITGSLIDERYAAFYQSNVATHPGRWGSILPNTLPQGLRRIEVRAADGDAALLESRIDPAGFPETIDPAGGLDAPILLDAAP